MNITVKRQAADEVKPYAYKMHFDGMSYAALMADAAKAQRFVEGVRSRVSLAVNLPIGNIQVRGRDWGWRWWSAGRRRLLFAVAPAPLPGVRRPLPLPCAIPPLQLPLDSTQRALTAPKPPPACD